MSKLRSQSSPSLGKKYCRNSLGGKTLAFRLKAGINVKMCFLNCEILF